MATIEFIRDPEFEPYDLKEPEPANHFLPVWYRELESEMRCPVTGKDADGNDAPPEVQRALKAQWIQSQGGVPPRTIKACMPFLDAASMGYIIPLPMDVRIQRIEEGVDEKTGEIQWGFAFSHGQTLPQMFSMHSGDQVAGCPRNLPNPLKFNNPWLIKTPKGYSCQFIDPVAHRDLPFRVFPGFVDTDRYLNRVNFPFDLNVGNIKWKNDEATIERGTPLMQVIPYKRENWKHAVREATKKDREAVWSTAQGLGTRVRDAYKGLFWQKKTWK